MRAFSWRTPVLILVVALGAAQVVRAEDLLVSKVVNKSATEVWTVTLRKGGSGNVRMFKPGAKELLATLDAKAGGIFVLEAAATVDMVLGAGEQGQMDLRVSFARADSATTVEFDINELYAGDKLLRSQPLQLVTKTGSRLGKAVVDRDAFRNDWDGGVFVTVGL